MKFLRFSVIALLLAGFSFTSCTKEAAPVVLIVDAGAPQAIQLPTNVVTLIGTVTSGKTSSMTYLWILLSGPSAPNIANSTSFSTAVGNLVAGTYVFQFQATNSNGQTAVDTTSVLVTAAPIKTLTLQPTNNPTETYAYTYSPNSHFSADGTLELPVWAWTVSGTPENTRVFIKFDLSQIPSNATIINASFSIYSLTAAEFALTGATYSPQYGTSNACYVQRITSSWTDASLDWNNMPSTTTTNEAVLPQTTLPEEDATNIDVTALIQDMQTNGNNGFAIRMITETYYNAREFMASDDPDATRHPKLVVTYQ